MIKKIFITLLLITSITLNFFLNQISIKNEKLEEIEKRTLDMRNTNDLIDTYSNLFIELKPANE